MKPLAQVCGVEANAVPNPKSRQFTSLDESVDGCATEAEQPCNIRHPEQLARGKVQAATSS